MSGRFGARTGRWQPVWVSLLLLVGCSGSGTGQPAQTPAATGTPAIEIGSVTETPDRYLFRTLATGDPVDVVSGSQGTFHIWGSVRFRGLDPNRPHVRFTIRRADDGRIVSDNPNNLPPLRPDATGTYEFAGLLGFLCSRASECPSAVNSLLGQPVLLRVDLEDASGRTGGDERQVVVRGSPLPTPAR